MLCQPKKAHSVNLKVKVMEQARPIKAREYVRVRQVVIGSCRALAKFVLMAKGNKLVVRYQVRLFNKVLSNARP
jgi:hypothetical protein